MPAAFGLHPVAGHPHSARRQVAPETADPDEVGRLFIPGEIARNPKNVLPFRLEIGRHFLNGVRRFLGHDRIDGGIGAVRLRERLVDGPARQDFHVFVVIGLPSVAARLRPDLARGQDTQGKQPR